MKKPELIPELIINNRIDAKQNNTTNQTSVTLEKKLQIQKKMSKALRDNLKRRKKI